MNTGHNHGASTHSAKCDELNCKYIARVHAHDTNDAVILLSLDLAVHNKTAHNLETDPKKIHTPVRAKLKKLG